MTEQDNTAERAREAANLRAAHDKLLCAHRLQGLELEEARRRLLAIYEIVMREHLWHGPKNKLHAQRGVVANLANLSRRLDGQ